MSVDRIATNLTSLTPQRSQQFSADVLGLQRVLDHGWIVTLADPEHPRARLSLVSSDATTSRGRSGASSARADGHAVNVLSHP